MQQIAQIARYAETGHKDDREDHQPAAPALAADEHDDRGNDDTDEAASEPVQQTESAEQKVGNEISETKRQNQERKQVSERIQSRCNADLVRTEREALRKVQHNNVKCHHHSRNGQFLNLAHVFFYHISFTSK